jgi:quercetin dioxygenase-like cupin family protein
MGTEYSITVRRSDSAGAVGIFEGVVPAGEGPPVHIHHHEDEVIHVIEGSYEFWLDGTRFTRSPGASVFLPRGVPHTFRVQSQTARILGIMTPGHFEGLFRELGVQATRRELPERGRVPFDVSRVMAEQRRRGTEVVGPPM